jgi:hypothetical protein
VAVDRPSRWTVANYRLSVELARALVPIMLAALGVAALAQGIVAIFQ